MVGFYTQKQNLPTRRHCRIRLQLLLSSAAVVFSLCISSGCATMQGARKDLHLATCGESDSTCDCSCGECTTKLQAADGATVHGENVSSTHTAGRHDLVIPRNDLASSGLVRGQPKQMTIEGMPGYWMPEQSWSADSSSADSSAAAFERIANTSRNFQQYANEQFSGSYAMREKSSVPFNQMERNQGLYCPPVMNQNDEATKETRAQIQVLSQQMSQMIQTQGAIKESQETWQQSHERAMLELKLQQATAERDRLERDGELDRELQRLREHNLETIDSLSQVVESLPRVSTAPVASSSGNFRSVPKSSAPSGQGRSTVSEFLPTVDINP